MDQRRTDRFSLADLLMIVLMCGLLMALFASFEGAGNPAVIIVLIGVASGVWSYFKVMRTAIPCPECGRRIIRPRKPHTAIACPQCGELQRGLVESFKIFRNIIFGLLALLFILVMVFGIFLNDAASAPPSMNRMLVFGVLLLGMMLTLAIAFAFGAYRWYSVTRPRELTCESCGTVIPAEQFFGPAVCPFCRQRHLRGDAARKETVKNLWAWFAVLAIVAIGLASLVLNGIGWLLGVRGWVGLAWLTVKIFVTAVVVTIAVLFATVFVKFRRLKREQPAIAIARRFAKEDGEVVKDGSMTVWYSGTSDPVPMIREQMEIARGQFGGVLGDEAVTQPRFRVLCFHDRETFSRFHARNYALVNGRKQDGIYVFGWNGFATLCTAEAPCRLTDPEVTVRSLYAYALFEGVQVSLPRPWLQCGVSLSVTFDGKSGELERLNRKMVAALGGGTVLAIELFALTSSDLMRLVRIGNDPLPFQKLQLLLGQSWSIFEYLCGEQAPEERRVALRRLLKDQRLKTRQEESFKEHFGFGFDALLNDWRRWVLDRGIGTYDAPPARVREALLDRVIPVVRDRQSGREDRIVAIREMGCQGFLFGADALIELLRDGDDIPKDEVVWALSMISGLAWGDEPDRWQDWWDNLPMTWTEPFPDGLETVGS